MTISVRQSSWIVTLSLAALAVAYLKFVWLPGRVAIQEMTAQLEVQKTFVAESTMQKPNRADVARELSKAEAVVSEWKMRSPSKRDIPQIFGRLSNLARESNLETGRFDPQPLVLHERLRELPLVVSCSGTFDDLYEYLRKVEALPVVFWVESMRIERQPGNAQGERCELNVVMFSDNL